MIDMNTTNLCEGGTVAKRLIVVRNTTRLLVRDESYVQVGWHVPTRLKDILVDNYFGLAVTVLGNLENDVWRTVEPGCPGPPRPNAQPFQVGHRWQHLDQPIAERRNHTG